MQHDTHHLREFLENLGPGNRSAFLTIELEPNAAYHRIGLVIAVDGQAIEVFGRDMALNGSGGPAQLASTLWALKNAGFKTPSACVLDAQQFTQVESSTPPFPAHLGESLSALAKAEFWSGFSKKLEAALKVAGY